MADGDSSLLLRSKLAGMMRGDNRWVVVRCLSVGCGLSIEAGWDRFDGSRGVGTSPLLASALDKGQRLPGKLPRAIAAKGRIRPSQCGTGWFLDGGMGGYRWQHGCVVDGSARGSQHSPPLHFCKVLQVEMFPQFLY